MPGPERLPSGTDPRLRGGSHPHDHVGIGAGNLVNDAYLAALAIEHDAAVATFDRDFTRFAEVTTVVPSVRLDDAR